MSVFDALTTAAVVAAAGCVARIPQRLWPTIALVTSVLMVVLRFADLDVNVGGAKLALVASIVLTIAGIGAWAKATNKAAVSSATIVLVTGAVHVLMLV